MPMERPPAASPPSQGQSLPTPPSQGQSLPTPPSQGQSLPTPPSQGQRLPTPPPDLQLPAGTEDVVPQNPRSPRTPTPTPTPTKTTAPIRRSSNLLPAAAAAAEDDTYNLKLLAWTAVSLADAEAERQLRQAHAEEQAGGSSSRPKSAGEKMKLLSSTSSSSSPSLPLSLATDGKNHASSISMSVPQPPPPPKKLIPSAAAESASSLSMAVPMPPPPEKLPSAAAQAASSLSMAVPLSPPKKLSSMPAQVVSSATGASASVSVLQQGDKKELELGEIPPEKPAVTADCTAAARKLLLGKGKEPADRGETSTGNSAHVLAGVVEITETDQKKMEVFVSGIPRDASEDDVRAALSVAGEISEIRIMMEEDMLQNGGYCFVAYREAAMATRAITNFANVEICGKPCRVSVPEGNERSSTAQGDPSEDSTCIYREDSTYAIPVPSYAVPPLAIPSYYPMYHNGSIVYLPDPINYGPGEPWGSGSQMRQPGSHRRG